MEKFVEKRAENSFYGPEHGKSRNEKIVFIENSSARQFEKLPGVKFNNKQFYDFKNVHYVSHCGMAKLIEHVKSLLQNSTEIQFVNVSEEIKDRIRSVGLDHVIRCN